MRYLYALLLAFTLCESVNAAAVEFLFVEYSTVADVAIGTSVEGPNVDTSNTLTDRVVASAELTNFNTFASAAAEATAALGLLTADVDLAPAGTLALGTSASETLVEFSGPGDYVFSLNFDIDVAGSPDASDVQLFINLDAGGRSVIDEVFNATRSVTNQFNLDANSEGLLSILLIAQSESQFAESSAFGTASFTLAKVNPVPLPGGLVLLVSAIGFASRFAQRASRQT